MDCCLTIFDVNTQSFPNDQEMKKYRAIITVFNSNQMKNGTAWLKWLKRQCNNKTSFIENCETSAIGRALGLLGIGIDTSIASAEEVTNAIANQTKMIILGSRKRN
jgi:hypothetical protein